jgi:tetratricopeptide (TPR) repeat protein
MFCGMACSVVLARGEIKVMTMLLAKSATLETVKPLERSMDCDQVWVWVQKELRAIGHGNFDDITVEVFRRAWDQETYDEMAKGMGYSADHLRAIGSELFKRLGRLLGETLSKSTFRTRILDRLSLSQPESKQDPRFLGRDRAVTELKQLEDSGTKIIVIQGLGGAGKTTLARKYFDRLGITKVLEIWIPIEGQVTSAEFWVEEWLRGVFNAEVGTDFGINLERLKLRLIQQSERVGVLIDNLDTILNGSGQIVSQHRRYVELLRMLSNTRLPTLTLITSREDLSEIQIDPEIYRLDGLDEPSWQAYLDFKEIQASPLTLHQVWIAANGNPKAMKILAGAARSDFDQNLDAYWASANQDILMEGELQALVEQQFQRLALTQPEAYQLLCRLGVYRYQDVPNVSLNAVLDLLWELPDNQARRALHALKERSLIDSRRNEIFWLHPMIRTESIKQLKIQGNWDSINRRAGEIWQTSVQFVATLDDALRAMEAYYHFIEIGDYDLACEVILALKTTPGGDRIALGWLFYRLGLMRQILSACETLVAKLPSNDRTSRLYNLQGYIHRLSGQIHTALKCHRQAQNIEAGALPQLQLSSWLHIGLCQRDLWELDKAQYAFERVLDLAQDSDSQQYVIYARCCLAYIHSHQGDRESAKIYLQQIDQIRLRQQVTAWGGGYSLLFLAHTYRRLGAWDAALEMFYETLSHAQIHQFAQIRGKALNGLAQIHRNLGNLTQALTHHDEALSTLEPLGANCIVAEALTQRAVTQRALGCDEASQIDITLATQLFQSIPAPNRLLWMRQQFQ